MTATKIDFKAKEKMGKGINRKLRVKHFIPSVLYGPDYKQGLAGAVSDKLIAPIANGAHRETTVVELTLPDGKTASALIRDVQRHPTSGRLLHLDFVQVVRGHKMKVEIPVIVVNKDISRGIKDGGMLEQLIRSISIDVLPKDIPGDITIDLKDMRLGAEVFVRDLSLPESAELLTDGDQLAVHITQPKGAALETAEEVEEAGQVEVVGKGKAKEGEE